VRCAAVSRGYDLVYLFQRPESMQRAADKAAAELKPGAWMVSLEFEVPTLQPQAVLELARDRKVWAYRVPFTPTGGASRQGRARQATTGAAPAA
jgi:hypothetical protein